MPAPRALRLLRPLLHPTQTSMLGVRVESSCSGSAAPPACPPCLPAPRPACRARAATALPGRRVVCCPPPTGRRPPCAGRPPPCPLTCEHRQLDKTKKIFFTKSDECGGEMDRVTQRLQAQDQDRREQYERDVEARRRAPPPPPPAAACRLPATRARELATDGRSYAVLDAPPPPRCTPGAGPPPAQSVSLRPPGDCRLRRAGVDPCAHQPRVLLSVDRSSGASASSGPEPAGSPEAHSSPTKLKSNEKVSQSEGLGSRIMQTLGCHKGGDGRDGKSKRPVAKRAGDSSWCQSLSKPAPVPSKCRQQSVAERLQRQPPKHCGKRGLHTTPRPPLASREAALANTKKLQAALKEREGLKEAGRDRVPVPGACWPPPPPPATGALEMRVPPGSDTLCVPVSVGKTPCGPPGAKEPNSKCKTPRSPCGAAPADGGSKGWLSLKKLQQKLSGARSEAPQQPAACETPPARPAGAGPCAPRCPLKISDLSTNTISIF